LHEFEGRSHNLNKMMDNSFSRFMYPLFTVLEEAREILSILELRQEVTNLRVETRHNLVYFWKFRYHMRTDKHKMLLEGKVISHNLKSENCEMSESNFRTVPDSLDPFNERGCCSECAAGLDFFVGYVVFPRARLFVFCIHNLKFSFIIIQENY
jgi:hypothetical protein